MQYRPENYEERGKLGESLHDSLQKLAAGIGGQLQQRRQRTDTQLGLQALGIEEPKAKLMSGLPDYALKEGMHREMLRPQEQLMSMFIGGIANGKTPQQAMQDAQEAMSGRQSNQEEAPQEQPQEMPYQQPNTQSNGLMEMLNQPGSSFPMMNQMLQQQSPQQQPMQMRTPQPRQPQQQMKKPPIGMPLQQGMALAQFMAQNQRQEEANLQKVEARTQKNYDKWTPEFNAMAQRRQSNDNSISSLNNSIETVKSGKVIQGPVHAMLKKAGLENIITTDETQLVEKMTQDAFNNEFKGMKGLISRPSEKIFTEMGKAFANLNNKVLAMEGVAHTKINEKKMDNLIIDKTSELSKAYQTLGKPYPPDLELEARKQVQDQIDNLAKDSNNFIKELVIRAAGGKIEQPTATFDTKTFSKKDMRPGKAYVLENGNIMAIDPDTGNSRKVEIINGKAQFKD